MYNARWMPLLHVEGDEGEEGDCCGCWEVGDCGGRARAKARYVGLDSARSGYGYVPSCY